MCAFALCSLLSLIPCALLGCCSTEMDMNCKDISARMLTHQLCAAQARKNLTEMDWLYGPFACEGGKSNPVLNCTQHLNHDSSYLSPVTGAAVVKGIIVSFKCCKYLYCAP